MTLRISRCAGAAMVLALSLIGSSAAWSAPSAVGGVPIPWRQIVHDLAAKTFNNPAWGFSHCQRDYALARQLAAADHITLDDDVLYAAAYLHDMAAFAPWRDDRRDHSDVGADRVDEVLKNTGFPLAKLDAVRAAIRTHMYYRDPVGPEAIYLHDADTLDWLGAIGVARMLALSDAKGGRPTGPDQVAAIKDNLAKTPGRVVSPAGRTLAAPRKAEAEAFLEQLRQETDALGASL